MISFFQVIAAVLALAATCLAAPGATEATKDLGADLGTPEDSKDLETAEWFWWPWLWLWGKYQIIYLFREICSNL